MTNEQIRNMLKYNADGRKIKDDAYIDFMVKRYKDNFNISGVKTNTLFVENMFNKTKKEKINILYRQIKEKQFKTTKKLHSQTDKIKIIKIDLLISKTGINESFNKGYSNEKYSIVPYLDIIIKTAQDGIIRDETKKRDNIEEWYYLYNTVKINNKLYGVKIDIKRTGQKDRFYVHRVNLINKRNF